MQGTRFGRVALVAVVALLACAGGASLGWTPVVGTVGSSHTVDLTAGLTLPNSTGPGSVSVASLHVPLPSVMASLERNQGPATGGSPWTCMPLSSTQATCGPKTTTTTRPAVGSSGGWVNVGGSLALPGLPEGAGGMLTYDFTDSYFVYFGGCAPGMCPSNQTWIYRDGFWLNDTTDAAELGGSPPAREWASMDWDGNQRAVLLFGGCGRICPLDDTWEFTAGAWQNITAQSCEPNCPMASYGSTLSWLPYRAGAIVGFSLLEGGCLDAGCTVRSNESYSDLGSPNGGWIKFSAGPGRIEPPARAFAVSTYDPMLAGVVLFGGLGSCGALSCGLNDTWEFQPTSGWTQITADVASHPSAREAAAFGWDNLTESAILFGGLNESTNTPLADTWELTCGDGSPTSCSWANLTGSLGPAPGARYEAAMAANGSGFAPILVGGWSSPSSQYDDQWQFGLPVTSASFVLTPDPTTLGYPTSGVVTAAGGTLPYAYAWGFPANDTVVFSEAASTQFIFPTAGTFPVDLTVVDAAGMILGSQSTVVVAPGPTIAAAAAEPTVDVGVNDTFTSSVLPGTGLAPFQTAWSFGDGHGALGSPVVHAFQQTGTYPVVATVSDLANHNNTTTVDVVVNAFPTVTATASLASTDVGVQETFAVSIAGGTAPFSSTWWFGDGSRGTGFGPTHVFSAPGTYVALVNTTDAAGAVVTTPVSIVVHSVLSATAAPSVASAQVNQTIQFSAAGEGGTPAYQYSWHFGDGSSASTASAQHRYQTPGTFPASVTVTDAAGASVTHNFTEVIAPLAGSGGSSTSFFGTTAGFATLLALVIGVMAVLVLGVWWAKRPPRGTSRPLPRASGDPPASARTPMESPTSPNSPPPPP